MAWSAWSGWSNTNGTACVEGSNGHGWNHAQIRYRSQTYAGGAQVQFQVQSMRGCDTPCFAGGYQEYGSERKVSWSGSGSVSGGTGIASRNFYAPCPNGGCRGDQGTWFITSDCTVTISNAAGSSGTLKCYTNVCYGMVDYYLSLSLSFPASTATLSVSGSNVKFDVYVGGTKVGSQVSSYSASHAIGASYTIKNINANSGYRLASSTSSQYTGTMSSSGNSVTIPSAVKTYSFSWGCTNCTGDPYTGGTRRADDSTSYSATVDTGTSYAVKDIKAKAGYFFSDSNTATKSDLSGTVSSNTSKSYTATACSVPSGGSASVVSRTWNSVTAKASVTSYGTPSSISTRYVEVGVAATSATAYGGRYVWDNTTAALATGNKTFTHANLVGCAAFKVGWYANNKGACSKNTTNSGLNSTIYYLPPAPLQALTVGTTSEESNVKVTVNIKGKAANGTDNISGAKVNTQYRYSIDGGTTYSSWTTIASSHTPDTNQTTSFHIPYNKAVTVQARQVNANDATQASVASTFTHAAVHPKPKAPIIQNLVWDDLDRTLQCQVQYNGNYGQPGDANFDHFDLEFSYNSDWTSPFKVLVGTTQTWNVDTSYMKPNAQVYIRAKCTNDWGEESVWDMHNLTVHRPIWGVVKRNGVGVNIRDILQTDTAGNFSQRDWIEGSNLGKNRIVKKV